MWVGSATRIGGVEAILFRLMRLRWLGLLLKENRIIAALTPIPRSSFILFSFILLENHVYTILFTPSH